MHLHLENVQIKSFKLILYNIHHHNGGQFDGFETTTMFLEMSPI